MGDSSPVLAEIPLLQQSIRDRCFHPSGHFEEFESEETEQSIPDRFEKQVAMSPDRVAIITRGDTLTFDAVNRTANRIAHAILAQRGESNEPVPILFHPAASAFPATLAVWKAGKIHVPIDPSLPRARVVQLFENLGASLVITNRRSHDLVEKLVADKVSLIDIDELDSRTSAENPALRISPETLAWIRFTSGSTGEPKGATQNHRNILHYVRNFTNTFRVCPEDRLFHPHFRTTATAYHCGLLTGAPLYPLDVKTEGMDQLALWIINQGVTVYSSNPTTFRHFLDSLDSRQQFPQLRLINLDGESVSRKDVERYKKQFPDACILVNRLGSGETGSSASFLWTKKPTSRETSCRSGTPSTIPRF
jgi:non-ribosomal peptide synthetase component F